jgi:tetratricopeptide (TPR) repeat protein
MSGRLDEGFAKYQRAVATWPAYAPAYYNIGVIHSERRSFGAAKEMYEAAITCHPSYPEAHCNLGVIHKEEGRLDEAIASYEHALAISPEFAIVANNLAIALTELGTRIKVAGGRPRRCATPALPLRCWTAQLHMQALGSRHRHFCYCTFPSDQCLDRPYAA